MLPLKSSGQLSLDRSRETVVELAGREWTGANAFIVAAATTTVVAAALLNRETGIDAWAQPHGGVVNKCQR